MSVLDNIEERFCKVTGYAGLSQYPMHKSAGFATDKGKSKDFAEVFTPPYIVDKMLQSVPGLSGSSKNLDLCAGHGQFTVRMLRKFSQENKGFDVLKYLKNKNFLAEIQLESCYKLLWSFGTGINLAIGDALQLAKLPHGWRGIWLYVEKAGVWVNITRIVRAEFQVSLDTNLDMFPYDGGAEQSFVIEIDRIRTWLNRIAKEPKMELDKLVNIPQGRELFEKWVRDVATDMGENWQNVKTPEWVAREMVRCVKAVNVSMSKILVLFNVEILEALLKEGVSLSKITFGSDSPLEEAMAQGFHPKLKTIQLGRSFEEMKKALEGKAGQYDVVLSNPPYQIMDGGFGASARPVYHDIVMYAIDELKPQYVCMITPSRWMAGGKGLDDYRARMLKDKHIRLIQDYPGNTEIFETVSVQGGVSYFLWDRDYNGLCEFNGVSRDLGEFDVLVRDNISVQILKKVRAKHTGTFCDGIVLPRKPFGMPTDFNAWVPEGTPGAVKCYCAVKDGGSRWVDPGSYQDTHRVQGQWKVCTGAASNEGAAFQGGARKVIAKTFVAEKGSVCIETYIVTGYFNTKKEAENYADYMRTRFYRFMLSLRVISQHINTEKFGWVPDLGNYTQAVTDADLYAHFNLTKKEIEHIEATIKEI